MNEKIHRRRNQPRLGRPPFPAGQRMVRVMVQILPAALERLESDVLRSGKTFAQFAREKLTK